MGSIKKYAAEFLGTMVLVIVGCGTAMTVGCDAANGGGYILTALAFGLAIVALAYSVGNVSGCHINPAVSVAFWINGELETKDLCGYIVSQILGAFAGAGILKGIFALGKLTDLGVTSKKAAHGHVAGLVIGLTLVLVHILGIGLTGTSVNPARSFGPALVAAFAGNTTPISDVWIFFVGPLAGAVLAAVAYRLLAGEPDAKEE